jgi:hypothetical protein
MLAGIKPDSRINRLPSHPFTRNFLPKAGFDLSAFIQNFIQREGQTSPHSKLHSQAGVRPLNFTQNFLTNERRCLIPASLSGSDPTSRIKKSGPGMAPGPHVKRSLAIHPPRQIAIYLSIDYYTMDGGICQGIRHETISPMGPVSPSRSISRQPAM